MDNNPKNINTSGTLPSNFAEQANNEQKKHDMYKEVDPESADETSALGSAPEDVMDIDETATAMGISVDSAVGPTPLNLEADLSNDLNK